VWRHEPALRGQAVVIVDCDEPRGRVLWACERSRKRGIAVDMRYAQAIGLCDTLQARVVGDAMLAAATAELQLALAKLSPRVDLDDDRAGTCWLDGDGLDRLFPRASWAQTIAHTIQGLGYRGVVVVGGSKFATYAVARAQRKPEVIVFRGDADERAAAARVKLDVLDIAPELEVALARLGIATVGELVRLPGGGILERFGGDAHRLYQLAAGERWDPIVPVAPPDTPVERVELDDDDDDLDRLAFVIKAALDRLLGRLAARTRACAALHVELACRTTLAEREQQVHCIKPAQPTLDAALLLRLVRLRLTGAPPPAPVHELRVWADDVAATREQLALFAEHARRDPRAADEAIARLRAELGDDAVVRAVLRDGHLPEASFGWERLDRIVPATPTPRLVQTLIRRVHARPQLLPPQPRQVRDDGWLVSGLDGGAVVRIVGPYMVSGGWWTGSDGHDVFREYHFAELRRGDCLWVYYDRGRHRWFCQGSIE
jgi:protein ImuB